MNPLETDSYQITVIPKEEFHEGDEIDVTTTATSKSPYVKALSATYTIGIETTNFTYNIEDNTDNKYLTLNLTNSVTYYRVEKAFGSLYGRRKNYSRRVSKTNRRRERKLFFC